MAWLKRVLLSIFAFLILGVFSLGSSTAQAQNEPDVFYFGVQGGIVQSSLSGEGTEASSRSGFTGGAHVMYNVNEALSVEIDFLYSKRGGTEVTATGGTNVSDAYDLENSDLSINYFETPLLVKVTAPFESVKMRALAGPSVNFLVSAQQDGSSIIEGLASNIEVKDRFIFADLTGIIGGEIAFPISVPGVGRSEIALDGRYTYGFIDIDNTQDFDIENTGFSGSLVFRIQI